MDQPDKENTTRNARARVRRPKGIKFSDAIAEEIFNRMAGGESLRSICRSPGMPVIQTVLRWVNERPDFAESYARATDMRALVLCDEMLEIADTPEIGEEITETAEGTIVKRGDMIAHRRLKVDARKWILAKLSPKKFGERLSQEISGPDGGPVEIAKPSSTGDKIAAFQSDFYQGFFGYRDEAGNSAQFGEEEAEKMSGILELFATGQLDQDGCEAGAYLARIKLTRKKIIHETDPTPATTDDAPGELEKS